MKSYHLYKRDMILGAAGSILLALFIFSTNPKTMSAFLLLFLPLLVMLTGYYFARLGLAFFTSARDRKLRHLALIISSGPTLVILLGSTGQLGLQDIGLCALLIGGFGWYLRRLQATSEHV